MEQLYRYQRRVYDALMHGRSVILQAPTGGGKTRAALYPFLENLERFGLHQKPAVSAEARLPLTCRYAVPMRVLASQFEQEYRDYITTLDERRDLRLRERYTDALDVPVPAIQTGETPHDPRFESPLTFCTIDQVLSSFIGSPYALGSAQANLNVGAVVGSYLVLDEFHLYPLEKGAGARKTTLAMLRLLRGLCQFVLMTATFSSHLLDELGAVLDAEVVRVTDDDELAEIMGDRTRTIQVSAGTLSAEGILSAHALVRARGAGASLVVCNTVAQAQTIYSQLRDHLDALEVSDETASTRLQLLHSRFTTSDRQAKQASLEQWLGADAWRDGQYVEPSTIVVATQVVEVGLNISVGALHTELAPANSIIQRAGRCARFAGQRGEVIVYHPLAPRSGEPGGRQSLAAYGTLTDETPGAQRKANAAYLPYDRVICEATWHELVCRAEEMDGAPLPFGFAAEQALIDVVHTDADAAMIADFKGSADQTLRTIKESLRTHEPGAGTELIRDVANVSVIIHDDPERISTRPWDWDAFSLRPSTLLKHWDELRERKEALGLAWVMMTMEPDTSAREESDNSRESRYLWRQVSQETHGAQVNVALRLALPSALATYDADLGFRLLVDDAAVTTGWVSKPAGSVHGARGGYGGKQGSYLEHITGLIRAYNYSVRREVVWVTRRLEARLGLATGSVDEAIRLAIACHDIGKLTRQWQTWAHTWQAKLVSRYGPAYAVQPGRAYLAKTDRLDDWRLERALQREMPEKRPTHACVGVLAAGVLIAQRLLEGGGVPSQVGRLALATNSAIARHHAPTAREFDDAAWDEAARAVIGQALLVCDIPVTPERLALLTLTERKRGETPEAYLVEPSFDLSGEEPMDTPALTTWLGFVIVRALRLCDQRAERDLG